MVNTAEESAIARKVGRDQNAMFLTTTAKSQIVQAMENALKEYANVASAGKVPFVTKVRNHINAFKIKSIHFCP